MSIYLDMLLVKSSFSSALNLLCWPIDPAETSIDVSFTSTTPAPAAEKPPDDRKAHTAPLDQGAAEQPGVSSAVERHDHDQKSDSRSSPGHTVPGTDQQREAKLWQARIKRPASAAAPGQPAARASAAPSKSALLLHNGSQHTSVQEVQVQL